MQEPRVDGVGSDACSAHWDSDWSGSTRILEQVGGNGDRKYIDNG